MKASIHLPGCIMLRLQKLIFSSTFRKLISFSKFDDIIDHESTIFKRQILFIERNFPLKLIYNSSSVSCSNIIEISVILASLSKYVSVTKTIERLVHIDAASAYRYINRKQSISHTSATFFVQHFDVSLWGY